MSGTASRLSRLSLETMPTTRSQSRQAVERLEEAPFRDDVSSSGDEYSESDMSDSGGDSDHAPSVIRAPSRLLYNLGKLPQRQRSFVRDVFNDPPKLALQKCRRMDNYYAFQMTELVTRSVRIYADDEQASSPTRLSCSCAAQAASAGEDGRGDEATCPHLLWLLDQMLQQTLYHHDHDKPVTMAPEGCAEEMGDPFGSIADHHLDVLAAGLHCPVVDPESDGDEPDATRVLEARELMSAIYAEDPDRFRPDIFDDAAAAVGSKVTKRHDLDRTVFRMLLDNHHFFNYFLAQARQSDPIRDPFRKLSQRVDHVLRLLSTFNNNHPSNRHSAETPRDAAWASRHILGSVRIIKSSIFARDQPLSKQEALSAVRALIHILDAVVPSSGRRSSHASREMAGLYNDLIGDRDRDFVISVLGLLPQAGSHFIHNLESVLDRIGVHGAPATYVERFRALLRRLRTSGSSYGVKRQKRGQSTDQLLKRMK